jgi:hypothetical protein
MILLDTRNVQVISSMKTVSSASIGRGVSGSGLVGDGFCHRKPANRTKATEANKRRMRGSPVPAKRTLSSPKGSRNATSPE